MSWLTSTELGDHDGLDACLGARFATYHELADHLRANSTNAGDARELFARITSIVVVGNTDDRARNHAATWDGYQLTLAPAFDICPQMRPYPPPLSMLLGSIPSPLEHVRMVYTLPL